MALNEHEVPRLDITICVDPPNDGKDQGPQSSAPLDWASGQYTPLNQLPYYEGYSQPSLPQAIPRINTSYEDQNSPNNSPNGLWDITRSPASSDSGWSNPPSPRVDAFGEDFHDDVSELFSENPSYTLDTQFQEEFDIETFLSLGATEVVQSPDAAAPSEYLTGPAPYQPDSYQPDSYQPDPYQLSPTLPLPSPPHTSPFPQSSLHYRSYSDGNGSPTFNLSFPSDFSNRQMGNNSRDVPPKQTHHRSNSDFLSVPPSPTLYRNNRSHSRGPMGHRSTISEGQHMFLTPDRLNNETSLFVGDFRGRGLSRAKSAPSSKAISRGRSPYDRPASQTDMAPRLEIPSFAGAESGTSTPDLESPSPSSAKDIVATDAMVQASKKRRKREANYFCSQCHASFTTENSKKRHESSHSGEKPYVCSKPGCGQTFSNDDDRKRHENKSKKHAQQ